MSKKPATSQPPRYDDIYYPGMMPLDRYEVVYETRWYLSYRPYEHHPEHQEASICPGDGYVSFEVAKLAKEHLKLRGDEWKIRERRVAHAVPIPPTEDELWREFAKACWECGSVEPRTNEFNCDACVGK